VIGEGNEFVVLKERRLVNPIVIKEGLLRLGFLLEITQPGSLPDAHLMAAMLDLVKTLFFNYNLQFFGILNLKIQLFCFKRACFSVF